MKNDNICAIATPYGVGAISIIRASGPEAISLVNNVFKGKNLNNSKTHTINYGFIIEKDIVIDEVLANIFIAPKSFDGENCVEINCHGGVFCTNKVLEVLLNNGFRLAEPGEFSKRAFLNRKIDLTEAEAIMDIVEADNMNALISGQNSLRSSTRVLINGLRSKILDIMAGIEVNIDYPEYEDAIQITNEMIIPKINELISEISNIIENSKISRIALKGIKVAIVGKPNVGKSSILNMLLDEEKAIVSNIAGTTRDFVEGKLLLGNVVLNLIDTAGIRESDNIIEKIGIEKTKKMINDAELILLVLDQSSNLDKLDLELLELTKNKMRIIISNKSDLEKKISIADEVIELSTVNKQGLNELEKKINFLTKVNEFNPLNQNYLSNVRQLSLLKKGLISIVQALDSAKKKMSIDLIEIDIKEAFDILGDITGESYQNELLDTLFSKFCLGK